MPEQSAAVTTFRTYWGFFKLVFKKLNLDFSSFLPLSIKTATIHMTLYLTIVFLDFINPPVT